MGVFKVIKKIFTKKKKRPTVSIRRASFVRVENTFWAVPELREVGFGFFTPHWPKELEGKLWAAEPDEQQLYILEGLIDFQSSENNKYTYNA